MLWGSCDNRPTPIEPPQGGAASRHRPCPRESIGRGNFARPPVRSYYLQIGEEAVHRPVGKRRLDLFARSDVRFLAEMVKYPGDGLKGQVLRLLSEHLAHPGLGHPEPLRQLAGSHSFGMH